MSSGAGCPVAAVNNSNHLRVYTQDPSGGIRESAYENRWYPGGIIANCKSGSPLAATSLALDSEAAHDATSGWYTGALNNNNFQVAANSTVGAAYLAGTQALRVYAQSPDNSIQEYGWDEWQTLSNLGAALPGTAIAVTSFSQPNQAIRLYFQDTQNNLVEMAHDSDSGWNPGSFSVPNASPGTALAVTTTEDGSIHVYYGGSNNSTLEKVHDSNSGWYDGAFSQTGMPGSQVAAINWGTGSGLNIRVYFQQPQSVPGVSEYQYVNGNWTAGQIPIPPA